MTEKFFPEALYELGFTDLVSVIPPGAQLTPSSKINQSQAGKVPGRRLGNGLWAGYDWRKHEASVDDVRQWCIDGANVGTRADHWPGVDIDCTDERIAKIIEDIALATLGPAPIRTGKAPKRLLMYRTDEPFSRMRLWVQRPNGDFHLVEVLGQGQQYLVHGTHPATMLPYSWDQDLTQAELTTITREQAMHFLDELEQRIDMLSIGTIEREGDGRPQTRSAGNQEGLLAPSPEMVRQAVEMVPNTNDLFPSRTDYLTMGYAIRAACGDEHEHEGLAIFSEWAERWEGNGRSPKGNDPGVVLEDWRRMRGPYSVGWSWLAEQARGFGFDTTALDFDVIEGSKAPVEDDSPAKWGDQWLADRVVGMKSGVLRYVPQTGTFLVWQQGRWQRDAELLADDVIKRALRAISAPLLREGATEKEKKENFKAAQGIQSAARCASVTGFVKSDRGIAVSMDALDHDPWALNTPAGIVDLKSGAMGPASPDALCTKSTSVPPDFAGACPLWKNFLAEATAGDVELERYLQRLCGYALTGSTREQHLSFIWGPGGNGKGVFLNTVGAILGDYHRMASMDTFTASFGEKHSTDVAMLVGARLVTASETQAGKRWDEARIKGLTGGDPVTARFMRQDNFTFKPQFKLVFIGNHMPEIRDVDKAMKRRIQIVPFEVEPKVIDRELDVKLRDEWPAILAWMIEGCIAWQTEGLNPPARVRASTDDYFSGEDGFGRWLRECVEPDAEGKEETLKLFESWREWANANGEFPGSVKRLTATLKARKIERWQDSKTRRMGFKGLRIKDRQDVLGVL